MCVDGAGKNRVDCVMVMTTNRYAAIPIQAISEKNLILSFAKEYQMSVKLELDSFEWRAKVWRTSYQLTA